MDLKAWLPDALVGSRNAVHFVTWRISSWQTALSPDERADVTRVLRQRRDQGAELMSFVVMDDHVHVLARCSASALPRALESWKSHTAMALRERDGRSGAVWQRDTFHRPVRDQKDLQERADYITGNPWKRWPFVERYPYQWEGRTEARSLHADGIGAVAASLAQLVLGVARSR
jgi:REP element-mobilizing transposase RayT